MSLMSEKPAIGVSYAHESGVLHVSGEARYVDDIPLPSNALFAAIGMSRVAHGRILNLDLSAVISVPGVVAVLTAQDIVGHNNCGVVLDDDPIFADELVEYVGQAIFAVVADSTHTARAATKLAKVEYDELEAILDVATALKKKSFVIPSQTLKRGDAATAIADSVHQLDRNLSIGGQEHFYLEGQVSVAVPGELGAMHLHSSTQHTSEVQSLVAKSLGLSNKDVTVECRRMGGAFGGKESQAALIACIAALGAQKTGRCVKLRLDRDDDMVITGKRHPFEVEYSVGFDNAGIITGFKVILASNCGRSADLSEGVNVRAMFHIDNCYYLNDVEIVSHRLKTHQVSHTAFRGFGGPQGMLVIESAIEDIARFLQIDPQIVRQKNYYGSATGMTTPYGMSVEGNIIPELVAELKVSSNFEKRRELIDQFNKTSPIVKKGIALTPLQFGIAFTVSHLNQAGALVNIYKDGSVQINHGGTEMGQGLNTKMCQVAGHVLQLDLSHIRCVATSTGKVPNTSPTAASAGSDLNGRAVQAACETIKLRLISFAAAKYHLAEQEIAFLDGKVHLGNKKTVSIRELVSEAYFGRISLSATGFYKTPKLDYDAENLQGRPFYYFCYGAAVSEVLIDTLTGESRITGVDILHDAGKSLNPAIYIGQVEGGFVQGAGWLTSEELVWDATGRLTTHAPSTYKIPTASDWPERFNVNLLSSGRNREENLYNSKAVGEPPLMLALSVFFAIRHAIESVREQGLANLQAPATPESILTALNQLKGN